MIRTGWIAWPEGQPEKARFAATLLGFMWLMNGPVGWRAMFARRRMTSYWPAISDMDPVLLARNMEAALAANRKIGGSDA